MYQCHLFLIMYVKVCIITGTYTHKQKQNKTKEKACPTRGGGGNFLCASLKNVSFTCSFEQKVPNP